MPVLLSGVIWHVCGYATSGNALCYMEYSEYHEYVICAPGETLQERLIQYTKFSRTDLRVLPALPGDHDHWTAVR